MFIIVKKTSVVLGLLGWLGCAHAIPLDEARHLLVRTGFGLTHEELNRYTQLEYEQAVDQLLDQVNTKLSMAPPEWVSEPLSFDRKRIKDASEQEKKAFRRARKQKEFELKGWWLAEMVNSDSQLTEKMVLFWHNHFTSSLNKVKQPVLLYRQNELFRTHAMGNYKQLAHAICKDPAMLGYLDNFKSSKKSPNENFARELLELFTLGEGNYTEKDIKEAARAFTGWSIDRKTGAYKFRKAMHDSGEKEFMGKRGNLNGDDITEIIFQQPEVAKLLIKKLWREFISETPDAKEVDRLAKIFHANDYDMKPLLKALFLSPSFRDSENYARLIKSPLDYIVGTLRMLDIPVEDGRGAAFASAHLGLNVFDPPNVKGWVGGKDWISSSSLLTRQQLLERMFRGNAVEGAKQQKKLDRKMKNKNMFNKGMQNVDLRRFLEDFSKQYSKQEVLKMALADDPVDMSLVRSSKQTFNVDDLMSLMSDPVYQLK